MSFLAILPLLIQGTTALTPLIAALSPTLAAVVPGVVAAASGTAAAKTLVVATGMSAGSFVVPSTGTAQPSADNPVVFLQEMLVAAGHPVTVDGIMGPQTLEAADVFADAVLLPLLRAVFNEALSKL